VVKFNFPHSKLREQPFFAKRLIKKYQISKSRVAKDPCTLIPKPMIRALKTEGICLAYP